MQRSLLVNHAIVLIRSKDRKACPAFASLKLFVRSIELIWVGTVKTQVI